MSQDDRWGSASSATGALLEEIKVKLGGREGHDYLRLIHFARNAAMSD